MSAFKKLSLGRVADRLAKSIGWSPIGRSIVIYSAEGPSADVLNGLEATVRSVDQNTMILEASSIVGSAWNDQVQIRLLMRHTGWTPFSMFFGPIAVVVQVVQQDGQVGPVAIALAAVRRRRDHSP